MKQLARFARRDGLQLEVIEGGSHTIVRIGTRRSVIPRHREINERTAQSIIKDMKGKS